MNKQTLNELLLLPKGSHRIMCPTCTGGRSKEKSMSVLVENSGVSWYCFRASCNEQGSTSSSINKHTPSSSPVTTKAVDKVMVGYGRMAVYDNDGGHRGWVHRSRKNHKGEYVRTPKSINNFDSDWCGLHFPSHHTGEVVLLVEDVSSANRMNPFFPTVALLGTNLNSSKIEYMTANGIKHGIIGLDEDATVKACKLARKESFVIGVHALLVDIKDDSVAGMLALANTLTERWGV